jgi:hypothetical protein
MVQLTDDLIAALDAEARRRGVSRSAVIREAIEDHVVADREVAIGRAIVDGYRRIPPSTPDEWGDLDREIAIAGQETEQRLAAEEGAAGFGPW